MQLEDGAWMLISEALALEGIVFGMRRLLVGDPCPPQRATLAQAKLLQEKYSSKRGLQAKQASACLVSL